MLSPVCRGSRIFGFVYLAFSASYLNAASDKTATSAAADKPAEAASDAQTNPANSGGPTLYIREYRVRGAHLLKPIDIQKAVYRYLGPLRTVDDVEHARAALEAAYHDAGYKSVYVEIPPGQKGIAGIVYLQVVEAKVAHLRVKGSRYFLPSDIKKQVPSLAEGAVPDFNQVTKEVVAMNHTADRQVTPALIPGSEPGTVDIDLNVKDSLPLHANVELNNRYSPNTTPLRLDGGISYSNLWQASHALGFNFQIAPEHLQDAEIFSGYYIAPINDKWSLMFQGTKQDSNVSSLGGSAVAGKGEIYGIRAIITLPAEPEIGFAQSMTLGIDYKHLDQNIALGGSLTATPLYYYPVSATYNASWLSPKRSTDVDAGIYFGIRGVGSKPSGYDAQRYEADGSFIYFRGDVSHLEELPWGFQAYAKVQGQAAGEPLTNAEQIAAGGLSNVRGYPEATALGDNGVFGTLELRSPSLLGWVDKTNPKSNEWRIYGFFDAGRVSILEALPQQIGGYDLASFGIGSRVHLMDHLNGSVDAAIPLINQSQANVLARDVYVTFRVWAEF